MKGVIMTNEQESAATLVYVIDEHFRIVYYSSNLKEAIPELRRNQLCYKVFNNKHSQCKNCPLCRVNQGKTIRYNSRLNDWFTVNSAPFEYPGAKSSHIIMITPLEKNEKSFLHSAADTSNYDELLELNYPDDSYHVAYHGKRQNTGEQSSGTLSTKVHNLAENKIHPDDRERFYDFWQLDYVGKCGIPEKLLATRHGEFRKLCSDGTYQWVQQLMIPVRQTSNNTIFVNSFFNIIDMPEAIYDDAEPQDTLALHNKKSFFKQVDKRLCLTDDGKQWYMLAIDFEKFKLFNEWYGLDAGDRLLTDLAGYLRKLQDNDDCIAGYFDNDDFALFTSYDEQQQVKLFKDITALLKRHSDKMNILPAFGYYRITDREIPAFKAYDRANLACASVKGNYAVRIQEFDTAMLQQLESEYLLLSDIQKAFDNQEFTFYLQPKCDMNSGKIVGAEALARWINRDKGMIPPGVFIPFLEKSGFVAELDTYIWEEVCKWQRKMLDQGAGIRPVSVNVSRTDLYSVDVPAYFCSLIKKYDLPPELIEIEITESAYAENDTLVRKTVNALRASGFHILMDDFGSAYSSLNMLKDISVDTLKIDMRFLDFNEDNTAKGIDILETVCNMANILGLGVIVEGVETEEQKNYLLSMKCNYGQGYYFYRPLPVSDFEHLLDNEKVVSDEHPEIENLEIFYLKDLLGKDMFSEIMINNMLGAVVFYDVYEGQIRLLRYNEQYAALLGNSRLVPNTHIRFGEELYQEDYHKIFHMFKEAQKNRHVGAEVDIRRRKNDDSVIWLHLKTFFLHKQNGHAIFYSAASDVTKMYKANDALRFLNNDMPGGYFRHQNNETYDFTLVSQRFLDILDYTQEEIQTLFDNKMFHMIHPDDLEAVQDTIRKTAKHSDMYSLSYRIMSKHGYIPIVEQSRLIQYNGAELFQGIILCGIDQLFKDK